MVVVLLGLVNLKKEGRGRRGEERQELKGEEGR